MDKPEHGTPPQADEAIIGRLSQALKNRSYSVTACNNTVDAALRRRASVIDLRSTPGYRR